MHFFKTHKKDIILITVILLIGIAGAVLFYSISKPGEEVLVTIDGAEYASYPLDKDMELTIETDYGTNKLVIYDNMAFISEADCENQLCVLMGTIKTEGECIVCLPHGLMVEIVSGK